MARVPDLRRLLQNGIWVEDGLPSPTCIEYRRRSARRACRLGAAADGDQQVQEVCVPPVKTSKQHVALRERRHRERRGRHRPRSLGVSRGTSSTRCDCGDSSSLPRAHRGRGPRRRPLHGVRKVVASGSSASSRAYELQGERARLVEPARFPPDAREWRSAADPRRPRTHHHSGSSPNNPRKLTGLDRYGLTVVEQVPLEVEPIQEPALPRGQARQAWPTITAPSQGARLDGEPPEDTE